MEKALLVGGLRNEIDSALRRIPPSGAAKDQLVALMDAVVGPATLTLLHTLPPLCLSHTHTISLSISIALSLTHTHNLSLAVLRSLSR